MKPPGDFDRGHFAGAASERVIADKKHEQAVRIAREELTRLDAEMQQAANAQEQARCKLQEMRQRWGSNATGELDNARARTTDARAAFKGACRLAERLGLIGEGEREFFKEKK